MPVPEFVIALRRHVGHAPLWLPAVTAVVLRDDDVLLIRRSDTLAWTPITGILDPGEQPAVGAVREVAEETGVLVEVESLAWVRASGLSVHVNGDEAYYLDHLSVVGTSQALATSRTTSASTSPGFPWQTCRRWIRSTWIESRMPWSDTPRHVSTPGEHRAWQSRYWSVHIVVVPKPHIASLTTLTATDEALIRTADCGPRRRRHSRTRPRFGDGDHESWCVPRLQASACPRRKRRS
jgi:8-oxo-dGTP pyrophosphatase MutT (NUDIX family)